MHGDSCLYLRKSIIIIIIKQLCSDIWVGLYGVSVRGYLRKRIGVYGWFGSDTCVNGMGCTTGADGDMYGVSIR